MGKWLFALFLIVHGLIHASWLTPAPPHKPGEPVWPFDLTRSWLLGGLGPGVTRAVGLVLVVTALAGFIATALAFLGALPVPVPPLGVVASVASLLAILVYWNSWFIVGVALDVALLAAFVTWPSALARLAG